jgi:membrane protease YdiL (CAAX protease family)
LDLLIVSAVFVATNLVGHSLNSAYAGTYALLTSFAACTWRLAVAHSSWRDLGLRLPSSWLRTILLAVALLVVSEVVALVTINPLARAAHWPPLNLSRFAGLRGNWHALLGWLTLAWTSAAIAEELVFRGFLISRLQTALRATPLHTVLVVLAQAVCFGAVHVYLGPRGVAIAITMGLLYGAVYVGTGRNLPALMLAHGATDSLSLIAIYAGAAS